MNAKAARRYVIVAPCRDEAATLQRTMDSLLAQSVLPTQIVVVDDGSTDATPAILTDLQRRIPSLTVVTRSNHGTRALGGGVVEAFNAGLATADLSDVEFICKLDTDLDLPPRYFEQLIAHMDADPDLASASGKPFFRDTNTGRLISEFCGDETSVGMTKFYRLSAFRAIGGFVVSIGWDVIDCHVCRMHGLKALSFDEPDLHFIHLRPMGSSHISIWHGRMRHGLGAWVLGTIPIYMFVSFVNRLNKRPFIVGAIGMLWGYVKAMCAGVPRCSLPGYLRFVRDYQLRAIVFGKRRAAEQMRLRARHDKLSRVELHA